MKFVLVTKDSDVLSAAKGAFQPSDELLCFDDWSSGLSACKDADMMFVDLLATLEEPHRIGGYEKFAHAKMSDDTAKSVPLVLIAPPSDYELDFMTGWPDFLFAQIGRPISEKLFRRASTWI